MWSHLTPVHKFSNHARHSVKCTRHINFGFNHATRLLTRSVKTLCQLSQLCWNPIILFIINNESCFDNFCTIYSHLSKGRLSLSQLVIKFGQFSQLYYVWIKISTVGSVAINPFTTTISLAILLTVCHSVLVMLVWRIWHWINL